MGDMVWLIPDRSGEDLIEVFPLTAADGSGRVWVRTEEGERCCVSVRRLLTVQETNS